MDVARQIDDEQTKLWNGPAGRAWIDAQECLDQMFKPLEDLLVEAAFSGGSVPRGRVLDVGCGTGSTTLAVARLLGANGCCVGIDISDPLVAAARARAERESTPACFIHANAQNHVFEPRELRHDLFALRRNVLRRLRPGLCKSETRRKGGRRVDVRRLAEPCGKPRS